jgi:hypothetical protein
LGVAALRLPVALVFADLLPKHHPYVEMHERFKEQIGGSNTVTVMLTVPDGDIFRSDFLGLLSDMTRDFAKLDAVNQYQIVSLTSSKVKEVRASGDGITIAPLAFPDVPQTPAKIAALRDAVLINPGVYGTYVSRDLKSALITVDFHDHRVDFRTVFEQVTGLIARYGKDPRATGVNFRVIGEPILYGWVHSHLPETMLIAASTIVLLAVLLFAFFWRLHLSLVPLASAAVGSIWSLGTVSLLGLHFDPLAVVVAFLIMARALSHSVQLIFRFQLDLERHGGHPKEAATAAMAALMPPGTLGILIDAIAMLIVALTPVPMLRTIAVIGTVWVLTIFVTAQVLTPLLLSYLSPQRAAWHKGLNLEATAIPLRAIRRFLLAGGGRIVLPLTLVVFAGSVYLSLGIKVGDANPGSPILWPASQYNQDWAAINGIFRGSDRMVIMADTSRGGGIKKPENLAHMARLQAAMQDLPEIGGSFSIADVLPGIRANLLEGVRRYEEIGESADDNAELMVLLQQGSEPGDVARLMDTFGRYAPITFYFRDHQGDTIRSAVARIKRFIEANPVPDLHYELAGGLVGLYAATNETIFAGLIEAIALSFLSVVLLGAIVYRSAAAGLLLCVPILLSNTVTFSYMAWQGIGLSISTVPIAALGIGLGVDYAIYIFDDIKHEFARSGNLVESVRQCMRFTGRAVLVTAVVLVAGVLLWSFSSLKFQADMGALMALWLSCSAFGALVIVPSLILVFKPRFVFGAAPVALPERPVFPEQPATRGANP